MIKNSFSSLFREIPFDWRRYAIVVLTRFLKRLTYLFIKVIFLHFTIKRWEKREELLTLKRRILNITNLSKGSSINYVTALGEKYISLITKMLDNERGRDGQKIALYSVMSLMDELNLAFIGFWFLLTFLLKTFKQILLQSKNF